MFILKRGYGRLEGSTMNKSFDEWMREQFPDEEPPELATEICELCERHGVPLPGVKIVLEELMTVVTAVSKLRQLTRQCEFEGIARQGFTAELFTIVLRRLKENLEV
jgi:hypothetical protein